MNTFNVDKINTDILDIVKSYLDKNGIEYTYGCSNESFVITGNNDVYISSPFFHECPF